MTEVYQGLYQQEAYNQQAQYQGNPGVGIGMSPQNAMTMKQSNFQGPYQQQPAQPQQFNNPYPAGGQQMVQMGLQHQQQMMTQVQPQIMQQMTQPSVQQPQMQAYHQPTIQSPVQQPYQVTSQPNQAQAQQATPQNSQYTTYRVPTYGGVQDSLVFDAINCIIEPTEELGGIYLGNLESACDLNILKKMKIRAVLTVAVETGQTYPEEVVHFHEVIPAEDMPYFDLTPYYEQSFEFIDRHRRYTSVLVHCFAGVSRSASIVIAYIMAKYNCTFEESFNYVREKRKQVYPNPGFIDQLKKFEAGLKFNPGVSVMQPQVVPQHMVQSSTFMNSPQAMQPAPQKYVAGYGQSQVQQQQPQQQVAQPPQQQMIQQQQVAGYQQGVSQQQLVNSGQQQAQGAYQVPAKQPQQVPQQFNYQQMGSQTQGQQQPATQAQSNPAYVQQYKVPSASYLNNGMQQTVQQNAQVGGGQAMMGQPAGMGINTSGYMGSPIGAGAQYSSKY